MPAPLKLTKYNPCHCGSGRFYKDCHMTIDNAAREERIAAGHSEYVRSWGASADSIEKQGGYDWMAVQLLREHPARILDIGCGLGHGLAALLHRKKDLQIVAVEENPKCLAVAELRLNALGVSVERVQRIVHRPTGDKRHVVELRTGPIMQTKQVTLIEGDAILRDEELRAFLQARHFDAIAIWLIGTHKVRQECETLASLEIRSSEEYRLRVQNPMYVFADEILRPGGVLNVVDRGEYADSKEKEEWLLAPHREQAAPTSLRVEALASFPYTELSKAGVPMEMTMPRSGRTPGSQLALNSVISRKPS